MPSRLLSSFFFFFNDTATTEIYTLSLHDALPISTKPNPLRPPDAWTACGSKPAPSSRIEQCSMRSEEHTSELQSQSNLVCRLLLEKKKKTSCQFFHEHVHPGYGEPQPRRLHDPIV